MSELLLLLDCYHVTAYPSWGIGLIMSLFHLG